MRCIDWCPYLFPRNMPHPLETLNNIADVWPASSIGGPAEAIKILDVKLSCIFNRLLSGMSTCSLGQLGIRQLAEFQFIG
jgi:hypothetical protein